MQNEHISEKLTNQVGLQARFKRIGFEYQYEMEYENDFSIQF